MKLKTEQEIEALANQLLKHLAPNCYIGHGLSRFDLEDAKSAILFIQQDLLASASESFEEWISGMDFHCQWEAENHLITLDAYLNYVAEVAHKAAALPLMKRIEELEKENKFQADVMCDMGEVVLENETLQKENEELKRTVAKINDDYWFMINLIERYSTDKDETLRDVLERMKFRKPMLEKWLKGEKK